MKKSRILSTVAIAMMLGTSIYAFDPITDAPKAVKEAFAKKFPLVKKVKWNKENSTEWEAEFKMDGVEYSANYLEDGTWIETEHGVKMTDVPSNVKKTLDTDYKSYKIEEAEISETQEGSVYEFEIKKDKEMMEVAIDNGGKVVKKEQIDKKDDKD